jgi:hypothetical protein
MLFYENSKMNKYIEQLEKQNAELQELLAAAEKTVDQFRKREHLMLRWVKDTDDLYYLVIRPTSNLGNVHGSVTRRGDYWLGRPMPHIDDHHAVLTLEIGMFKTKEDAQQHVEKQLTVFYLMP